MAFQRKEYHREENCLNCGYPLVGPYCANCGQKAFLHKDSFVHMVGHFVGDYFHYSSKFWRTISVLFSQPGKVTVDYNAGKRTLYLNPIQLYFFVTTLFFLLVAIFPDAAIRARRGEHTKESTTVHKLDSISTDGIVGLNVVQDSSAYRNQHDYDSAQAKLPAADRDNFFRRLLTSKFFALQEKYKDGTKFNELYIEKLQHGIAKVFFILLPFFALSLQMVNYRKKIFYIDHLIFSLHVHAVLFSALLASRLIYVITASEWVDKLLSLTVLAGMLVYLFLALRKVYPTTFVRALLKLAFLFFVYVLGFIVAMSGLAVITFINM